MGNNNGGEIIIGILTMIATAIIVAQKLFPIFLLLTALAIFILIVVIVFEIINDSFFEFSKYVGMGCIVLFGLTLISWFVGFGIGGTPLGEASLEVYYAVSGAEQEISNEFNDAIALIIVESCQTLDEESCELLKTTAKNAQTIQEVSDKANQLKKLSSIS